MKVEYKMIQYPEGTSVPTNYLPKYNDDIYPESQSTIFMYERNTRNQGPRHDEIPVPYQYLNVRVQCSGWGEINTRLEDNTKLNASYATYATYRRIITHWNVHKIEDLKAN